LARSRIDSTASSNENTRFHLDARDPHRHGRERQLAPCPARGIGGACYFGAHEQRHRKQRRLPPSKPSDLEPMIIS